jgi:hypothetical protein
VLERIRERFQACNLELRPRGASRHRFLDDFLQFSTPSPSDEQPDADGGVARRHGQNRGGGEGCGYAASLGQCCFCLSCGYVGNAFALYERDLVSHRRATRSLSGPTQGEQAAEMANHAETRTTQLYDRRSGKAFTGNGMSARIAPQYRQTAAKYCQPLGKLPSTCSFSEPATPTILLQQGHRADTAIPPFGRVRRRTRRHRLI